MLIYIYMIFCLWGKILSIGHVQKIIVPLKSMHMVINTLKQCFTVLKQQKNIQLNSSFMTS